jgi:ferrous iron transport protein A
MDIDSNLLRIILIYVLLLELGNGQCPPQNAKWEFRIIQETAPAMLSSNQSIMQNEENLSQLKKGDSATIIGLSASASKEQLAVKTRLLELGFAPGAKIRVVAESFPRRDPMAVRVGNTTFALRRHEAAMILITRADINQPVSNRA